MIDPSITIAPEGVLHTLHNEHRFNGGLLNLAWDFANIAPRVASYASRKCKDPHDIIYTSIVYMTAKNPTSRHSSEMVVDMFNDVYMKKCPSFKYSQEGRLFSSFLVSTKHSGVWNWIRHIQ